MSQTKNTNRLHQEEAELTEIDNNQSLKKNKKCKTLDTPQPNIGIENLAKSEQNSLPLLALYVEKIIIITTQ